MTIAMRAFVSIGLACAAGAASAAAAASDVRTIRGDGVVLTHRAKADSFCVRPITDRQARRLGIRVHATECKSRANWAREGLHFVARGQQVASTR